MVRVAAALLLLAGAGSAQVLFSLQRLGEPRALLPALTLLRGDPTPDSAETEAPDYKQQVEQRNAECYQQCKSEFASAAGSAAACERGCRLFALGEAKEPKLSADEHRDKCAKDCATAYPVVVEQHSCQSGCHHQRPKQQDEDGAPVVMSVVRKYSFESEDGRQVRRSQSSVLVHDGDKVRVIEGPERLTVSGHGPMPGSDGPFPGLLDGMMERMHQAMRGMMQRLNGPEAQPEPQNPRVILAEQRRLRDRIAQAQAQAQARHDLLVPGNTAAQQAHESGWHRAWRCAPPYVVLGVLLLGTALVLYTCYCLVVVVRRRRRSEMREQLVQHEEVMAESLPPKYALAVTEEAEPVTKEAKEAPPAYSSIDADQLPPKLDV